MDDKELERLVGKKTDLIIRADLLLSRIKPNEKEAKKLLAQAAPLEEQIGNEMAARGQFFGASINWTSAGTCYSFTGQVEDAVRVYNKVIKAAEEHPGVITEVYLGQAEGYIKTHN